MPVALNNFGNLISLRHFSIERYKKELLKQGKKLADANKGIRPLSIRS